ncbi:MAG TPA: proton-conducting transporter membrane subunit [Chitinophagales bacterium]|nr:proton-conducting transporter membrane subunit [Chitinophagales bacterium]
MMLAIAYLIITATAILLIPFFSVKWKGIITVSAVIVNALLASLIAINVLRGENFNLTFYGTLMTGEIPVRIDALSGWFILLINFTLITGAIYGLQYMKQHREQTSNITIHCIAYLLAQSMLTIVCAVQNAIVFLFAWEIMALSVAVLVLFEHYKPDTIKAGINYIIQSHLCIVFLSLGFIWVASHTNSYDFNSISAFTSTDPTLTGVALFLCFFIGFAFKAGFVPFHTWLPYAHPAAPSHVSGVMSGVVIKIGIYGILRMILLIKTDYTLLGFIILFISIASGVYGVMLAIVQHNLKKLLAYHSIENIGIIGIGTGLGTIGIGTNNLLLATLGFAGGMLHVLNHSLFKSLLFYGAGNVYQATHTMNIEHLGGIVKKMPHTSVLFLVGALAICGLPPFNGFVSEFLIYSGLFNGLKSGNVVSMLSLLFSIFGLVIIGGLAMLCFTKAFGAVFLGNSRHHFPHLPTEGNTGKLIPMYMVMGLVLAIGLCPDFFLGMLHEPVKLFTDKLSSSPQATDTISNSGHTMMYVGWCSTGLMALTGIIFFIRKKITAQKPVAVSSTWGCGYVGDTAKMQYTAGSFVRTYRKLAEPLLLIHKKKKEVIGIFPKGGWRETHPYDLVEEWLIDFPLKQIKFLAGKFRFLQNGMIQMYTLYGVVFIILVLGLPVLYSAIKSLIEFLNQL